MLDGVWRFHDPVTQNSYRRFQFKCPGIRNVMNPNLCEPLSMSDHLLSGFPSRSQKVRLVS